MPHKLTPEERQQLKQRFLNTTYGKFLVKNKSNIRKVLASIFIIAFIILTIGTFVPYTWGIKIPYPLSIVFGNWYGGFTHYYTSSNIVIDILRTDIASHHMTDIMCMWVSYWIMVIVLKKSGIEFTSALIYAALFVVNIIGYHEFIWFFTYDIVHFKELVATQDIKQLAFSGLAYPYAVFMFITYITKGYTKRDFYWITSIVIFYIVWGSLGFPITWGYYGQTQYYHNIYIILIEEQSWIFAFLTFLVVVPYTKIKNRIF